MPCVRDSMEFAVCVILHEMCHAYLYGCQAQLDSFYGNCITSRMARFSAAAAAAATGSSALEDMSSYFSSKSIMHDETTDDLDYGITGHGRAFLHLVKSIQDQMEDLLGFEGDLGALDGVKEEVNAIVKGFCHGSLCTAEPLIRPLFPALGRMIAGEGVVVRLLGSRDFSGLKRDEGVVEGLVEVMVEIIIRRDEDVGFGLEEEGDDVG